MFKKKEKEKADLEEIAALKRKIAEMEKGQIKDQALPELPEIPMPKGNLKTETVKGELTETMDANMITETRNKTIMWLAQEYSEQYGGTFLPQEMANIDTEATMLNLLFAIFGELRLIREQKK